MRMNQKYFIFGRYKILCVYINFLIILIFSIWVLGSLLDTMEFDSVNAAFMCMIVGFLFAYVLCIYVNQDKIVREERKAYIGIVVTLIWLVVVAMRLNKYISDNFSINSEDSVLLVFSMIFTFPTIFAWIKNIPEK